MTEPRRAARPAGPPTHRPVPTPPKQQPRLNPDGTTELPGEAERAPGAGRRRRSRPRRRRSRTALPDRPVVLIGPMAAGKTSLGRRLAKDLGVRFLDSDAIFVQRHGPITEFFSAHGEAEFRRIEAEIIAEHLREPGTLIFALGGGAVLRAETRELLKEVPVILLMTTQRAVLRTANLSKRPLLRDDPNAWGRILDERRAFYEEVSDVTFRTDRATKDQLTQRAVQWVRARGRAAHQQPTAATTSKEHPPS